MVALVSCDECGRKVDHIHRRYKGHGYCGSCYAREFIVAKCPCCKRKARLPRKVPEAICRACESDRPCVRCGEQGKPVGKITEYGVVCNSCARYFEKEKPCECCGKLTYHLTKVSRFKDDLRRCRSCATVDYGTCSGCGHYRLLSAESDNKLCEKCQFGELVKCRDCGELMMAGRGSQCEKCYWKQLLETRIKINKYLLKSDELQEQFERFGHWLGSQSGYMKSSIMISQHVLFFQELEIRWQQIPSYRQLLVHFGADKLRRSRKIIEWFHETGLVKINLEVKNTVAEEQRVGRILCRVPGNTIASEIINGYVRELWDKFAREKISLRTLRLSLTPAIALVKDYTDDLNSLPNQGSINRYLADHPGQRASLSGFVGFIKRSYDLNLELVSSKNNKERKKVLEDKIADMATVKWRGNELYNWVKVSLDYFHGLSLSKGKIKSLMNSKSVQSDGDGFLLKYNGAEYYIPLPFSDDQN